MLLDPQGNILKKIENAEAVARLREDIKKQVAPLRMAGQELLENPEASLGTPMSPSLFIEKLRKFPGVIVEPGGWRNAMAVRTMITGEDGKPEKKYISGFLTDRVLAEYDLIIPDQFGTATRKIRGWRTVLLDLFHAQVVPLSQLKAAFGDANGQRSNRWQEQTQSAK
jgi:hypothetical protein